VGSKFRLSPMIASLVSRRLEGQSRNKAVTFEEGEKARASATEHIAATKTGPPTRKSGVGEKEKDLDLISDRIRLAGKVKETTLKGKALPYVDVPPLKAALRTPVVPVKEDQMARNGPAYKSRAPVEIGVDIEKLVESVLDLEISVPLRSLAGVSGQIQKEIRKQVTKARLPVEANDKATANLLSDSGEPLIRLENIPISTYTIMTEVSDDIPEGSFIADDPVLQYLSEHKDVNAEDLVVAAVSEPLRAIYLTINRVGQEECLLDSGSMIVSMARESAVQLGLNWDPSIRVNMESASNHLEKTLGLARNVRFSVAGLQIYLQVHILEKPPYRVLLGRPFDTFTSSTNSTKTDGSSELVLTDPNTQKVAIVPTYQRGAGPEELQKQRYQGF
jgi:hypothetical protein